MSLPPDLFPRRTRLGCPKRRSDGGFWYLWPGGALFWRSHGGLAKFCGYVGTRAALGPLWAGLDTASAVARRVEGGAA